MILSTVQYVAHSSDFGSYFKGAFALRNFNDKLRAFVCRVRKSRCVVAFVARPVNNVIL